MVLSGTGRISQQRFTRSIYFRVPQKVVGKKSSIAFFILVTFCEKCCWRFSMGLVRMGLAKFCLFLFSFFFAFRFHWFFAFFTFFCSLRFSLIHLGQGKTTTIYWKHGQFHSDPVCNDPVQNFPVVSLFCQTPFAIGSLHCLLFQCLKKRRLVAAPLPFAEPQQLGQSPCR